LRYSRAIPWRSGSANSERAAERIARAFATEQAPARASRELRSKLENYRLAKVRANLSASSPPHAAATELVREHRLYALERL
jgi:hypothetical protein